LQRNLNFSEMMKDPLSELYESRRQATTSNFCKQTAESEKKLVIIFHGAPYTGKIVIIT
jgi:hypothetical protein